jgi:hypothetical protein
MSDNVKGVGLSFIRLDPPYLKDHRVVVVQATGAG